jgi:hypothetical protein
MQYKEAILAYAILLKETNGQVCPSYPFLSFLCWIYAYILNLSAFAFDHFVVEVELVL